MTNPAWSETERRDGSPEADGMCEHAEISFEDPRSLRQSKNKGLPKLRDGVKERTSSFTKKYRFGFNNQAQETELGEYYSFEYRVHDARLGRFLSVDPLAPEYPWNSTYAFAENRVIDGIDLEGMEWAQTITSYENKWEKTDFKIKIYVFNSSKVMSTSTVKIQLPSAAKEANQILTKVDVDNKKDYNTQIEYEFVSEKPKTGLIVEIVDVLSEYDEETKTKKITYGETEPDKTNNNVIKLTGSTDGKQITLKGQVLAHELGHQGGLRHPDFQEADPETNKAYIAGKVKDNLMISGEALFGDHGGGTGLTGTQMSIISSTITKNNPKIKICPDNLNKSNEYTANPVPLVYGPCFFIDNPKDVKKTETSNFKHNEQKDKVSKIK